MLKKLEWCQLTGFNQGNYEPDNGLPNFINSLEFLDR
jgi:hypothetical protein